MGVSFEDIRDWGKFNVGRRRLPGWSMKWSSWYGLAILGIDHSTIIAGHYWVSNHWLDPITEKKLLPFCFMINIMGDWYRLVRPGFQVMTHEPPIFSLNMMRLQINRVIHQKLRFNSRKTCLCFFFFSFFFFFLISHSPKEVIVIIKAITKL